MDPRLTTIRLVIAFAASVALCWVAPWWAWVPVFGLMMPPLFGVPCTCCSTGSGSMTYQVDLSGFTNNGCSNCASYNGSFVVSQPAVVSAYTCTWSIQPIPGTLCDIPLAETNVDILLFGFTRSGGNVDISVELRGPAFPTTTRMLWKETGITPDPDCTTFSSRAVPFDSTTLGWSNRCTHDSSDALVTSL